MNRQTRFAPAFTYLLSAMVVWTAFFMGSYSLVAAICAFRLPDAGFGLSAAQLGLGAATLMAFVATSFLAFRAWRSRVAGHDGFATSLVLLQSVVALIALAWNFLPLVFLDGCGLQELGSV